MSQRAFRVTSFFLLVTLFSSLSNADVSHFFAPDYGSYFQQQQQQQQQQPYGHGLGHPFQFALTAQPQAHLPQGLYQAPPASGNFPSYPQPVAPTPAPVAPTAPTTTEFTLPEIVENRLAKDHRNFIPLRQEYLPPEEHPNYESSKPTQQSGGYYYAKPSTTTTTTTTERPRPIVVQDEDVGEHLHPGYDYHAPPPVVLVVPTKPTTPGPVYLPPESATPMALIESADGANALRVRVKEMRCLNHRDGYFRSVLKVDSFVGAVPTVDADDDVTQDRRCELKLTRSFVVLDIGKEDFQTCGVRECGKDLCLRVRFPAIRGMRTGTDAILTLHCKTQDRVAVKTHALKVGVANDVQARSIGTYAHGGAQNPFRTHVELLRKSSNGYTRPVEANDAVQLGEELLLRAHVITGDGWNHTKLTDVQLQRISPAGELLNTAQLVTPHGCLNPSMQSICAHAPSFDPPLGHKLLFKAVMFQGMHSGDELVMSMRITGCLAPDECQVATHACHTFRRKRDAVSVAKNTTGTEISEISHIAFRVAMRNEPGESFDHEVRHMVPQINDNRSSVAVDSDTATRDTRAAAPAAARSLVLIGSLAFVALLMSVAVFATVKLRV